MDETQSRQAPDDIDLGALWRAVAGKKRLLAGIVTGAALVTFIALQFVTPLYTSQARILIEQDDPFFLRPREEQRGGEAPRVDPEAVASQVQVLLSRDLAYEVVKELKLDGNPEFTAGSGLGDSLKKLLVSIGLSPSPEKSAREERALDTFERRLSVYQVSDSRVIAIDFSSPDPKTAAAVSNSLAAKYLDWARNTKLDQTKGASIWLNEQIKTLRERVAESEEAVEKFRSSSGLIEGANNVSLETQQLSELNTQLIMSRAQRSEAEARANLIQRMLDEKGDVASAPDVLKSALIQRLLEQRVQVQRQLAELSATLMPSHPRIRELKSELDDLQSQIRQEAGKVVGSLENEAQIAGARETSLRASLDELKKSSSGARESEIKLRSLEREAKANRDLLESYLARYSEASARDEMSVPAHATVIASAYVEDEPSFPLVLPITALVACAAGLFSVALLIARELMTGAHVGQGAMRPEPRAQANLDARRDAPVSAPRAPHRAAAGEPVTRPRRRISHARSLKAAAKRALSASSGELARVAIVTASSHNANTAKDALDFARALAASRRRVAIVDFSTSGRNVAGLAGLPGIPGLGELLAGAAGFEDVVKGDPDGTVQIVPAGVLPRDVFAEGLFAGWPRILNALRQTYDCVVIHASLSGARRLIAGLGREDAVSVMLMTEGHEDANLLDQIAEHLLTEDGAALDMIACKGSKAEAPAAKPPALKPGASEFGKRAAAAI